MRAVIFTHVLYLILIKTFTVKGASKYESKVELRAVLLSCPARDSGCDDDDPLSLSMKSQEAQILHMDPHSSEKAHEEKAREFPSAVKDCKRKLIITLKIKNNGKVPNDDEFIVVDHVFDPMTGGRGRLLSPVVIKLRQEQMVQLYGLQFQRAINSDPFEEQRPYDSGCSADPQTPSCGTAMYEGKPIPFSEGFCCATDPHVNTKRQLSPLSRPDSFRHRNRLLYMRNGPVAVDKKMNIIYNPDFVKLKPGTPAEDSTTSESDGGEVCEVLSQKLPNFFFENDRKIVCDTGDFMKELCDMREDNSNVTERTSSANPVDKSQDQGDQSFPELQLFPGVELSTVAIDMRAPPVRGGDLQKNTVELQNFIKSLNLERASGIEPLMTKGIRGKRENRSENKKLHAEENLRQFGKNRRELPIKISRRRLRKSDETVYLGENWNLPPRYFFSHDRDLIDPLESLVVANNSYDILNGYNEKIRELLSKDKNYRRFNADESFNNREISLAPKYDKLLRKNNRLGEKVAFKMEKGNGELGRSEKVEEAMSRNEAERRNENADIAREPGQNLNDQFSVKNNKHFLYQGDQDRLRYKYLLSGRNKQDLQENKYKMPQIGNQQAFRSEKFRNLITNTPNGGEENLPKNEKENQEKTPQEPEDEEVWETLQFSTEKITCNLPATDKEAFELEKMITEPPKKDQKTCGIPGGDEEKSFRNVDFSLKIIPSNGGEIYPRRHYTTIVGRLSGKSRTDVPSKRLGTAIYDPKVKVRKNGVSHYSPFHKLYVYEQQKKYPLTYQVRGGSDAQNRQRYLREQRNDPSNSRSSRAPHESAGHSKKKPLRGRFSAIGDSLDGSSYSTKWREGNGFRESHSRGRARSELHRQKFRREPERNANERVRKKRSAPDSFQPARGFFESDFDSQSPDAGIIHELGTCGRRRSCQFSSPKQDNLSTQENVSSLKPPAAGKRKTKMSDKERLMRSYLNAPDYVLQEIQSLGKDKREMSLTKKSNQIGDSPAFEYADAEDVAHCMRFGDLWYSMYSIRKPMISQVVGLQLFDKHIAEDGSKWRDLTKGKMVRLGSFLNKAEDELPTISATFSGERSGKTKNSIDPDSYFLLIPSHVSDPAKAGLYPQLDGGPQEYMLVSTKEVSSSGECNTIGTSFEAFAGQPDRCAQKKGSCLKRQLVDLWREDMEARIRGKRGRYFVENFGNVHNSPIKSYTNLTGEFLALEYYGEYTSMIELEVKADSNVIVRKGSIAQIPVVYVDGTSPKKTRIFLTILNNGLTSSNFRPRLADCPPDLDVTWCPLEGPLTTISPHQRHDFKLDLSGTLPSKEIPLTVQVLNQANQEVALRKIVIKRHQRCVCAFHCKCNCYGGSKDGRTCRKLSMDDYRKAGYVGQYPYRGGAAEPAPTFGIIKSFHVIFVTMSTCLLLFGVVKGIVGIFLRKIGIAGVRVLTGPRRLSSYYESELRGCSVLFNAYGYPVHPTTCRPVQIVPLFLEVVLNFFFFFLYPLKGLWVILRSFTWSYYSNYEGCCPNNGNDLDTKSSRPLLSKDPDPTCVHYNLTTINTKKSKQDYLPYPPYKGDDDPLEEDDTEFVLQEMKRYRKK